MQRRTFIKSILAGIAAIVMPKTAGNAMDDELKQKILAAQADMDKVKGKYQSTEGMFVDDKGNPVPMKKGQWGWVQMSLPARYTA